MDRLGLFYMIPVFSILATVASTVRAQETTSDVPAETQEPFVDSGGQGDAVTLYRDARTAYDEGRYQEAVEMLREALALDPEAPDLYYNIALTYEHLQDYDAALRYLEQYLDFDLDEDEQARVHRMMARIRGAREHSPEPEPEPQIQTQTQTRVIVQRIGRADAIFWSMVGATILFAGAAVVTGALALHWEGATEVFVYDHHGDESEYQRWVAVANNLSYSTDALIGAASATALASLLLCVLRTRPVEQETEDDGERSARSARLDSERRVRRPRVGLGPLGLNIGWEL